MRRLISRGSATLFYIVLAGLLTGEASNQEIAPKLVEQPGSSAATGQSSISQEAQKEPESKQEKKEREKKEKQAKKDKDKNKDRAKKDGQPDKEEASDSAVFSETAANPVLADMREGLEGHSQRQMLSAFDGDKMDGYLSFEDQVQALFQKYESFRVHYRILQSSIEGARGVVLVDMQMEELPPREGTAAPVRKDAQMRFELERGRKGWKIVDFRPREFFS